MIRNKRFQTSNRSSAFRHTFNPVRSWIRRVSLIHVICGFILVLSIGLFGLGLLQQENGNNSNNAGRVQIANRHHGKGGTQIDTVAHLRKDVLLLAQRQGVRQSYSHRVRSLMYRRSLAVFNQAVPVDCVCPSDNTNSTSTNSTTQSCDCDDMTDSNSTTTPMPDTTTRMPDTTATTTMMPDNTATIIMMPDTTATTTMMPDTTATTIMMPDTTATTIMLPDTTATTTMMPDTTATTIMMPDTTATTIMFPDTTATTTMMPDTTATTIILPDTTATTTMMPDTTATTIMMPDTTTIIIPPLTTTQVVEATTMPVITPAPITPTTLPSTPTTLQNVTTTVPTTTVTTLETTTALIAGTLDERSIAIEIFGATIGGMVGLCFCCYYCIIFLFVWRRKKLRKQRYDVETVVTPKMLGIGTGTETVEIEAWRWALLKEDMIRDGMAKGNVSVLEFAIQEARSSELYSADAGLIAEAEAKLNEWRRAQNLLEDSLASKDLSAIQDYMARFAELDIKDETGIYRKCEDLMENRRKFKDEMKQAVESRNEQMIIDSMAKFRNLNLSPEDTNSDSDLISANLVLNEIIKNRALEGKTHDDVRNQLREAVDQQNATLISAAISKFEAALIPDLYGDLEKAKRTLNEIEVERLKQRDETFQSIIDASQKRDAKSLSAALQEGARCGVDPIDLREGEKLLKLLEREDQLLHQMRELIAERDSGKLLEAIAIFRTPGLQLVDKTGDVSKADDLLKELREKERLHRAKGDAMWRLQQARSVGDVVVMDGMIKALDNLASAGEEVDEAMLIRAKTELDTLKGRVDYRKRMEAIKSGITRMAKTENIPQLADLIEQMVELSAEESFTMTADDTRVLDESRGILHDLRRKHAIIDDIKETEPLLKLPLVPDSLKDLTKGVEKMTELKNLSNEFPGVFTDTLSECLSKATEDVGDLKLKVDVMESARNKLETAVDKRDFEMLIDAISNAELAPFIEPEEIKSARILADFLDPIIRTSELRKAIKSRDIESLTKALQDFGDANIEGEVTLLEKGERTLKKLVKLEKKQRKANRKRKREEEKRNAEIASLNQLLQEAIDARDLEALQDALDACENSGYRDDEIPLYPKAEEIYDDMTVARLRANIEDGIGRRDIFTLEKTIDEADYGGYVADLGIDYQRSKDLLYHLRELHKLRDAVAGMDRSLISELRNYPTPPKSVHVVMSGTMLLLGEPKENIKDWHALQVMIGKMGTDSLTRRVRRRAPGDISRDLGNQVETMLEGFDIDSVGKLSKCAGAFFAWIICMIKESRFLLNAELENAEVNSSTSSNSEITAM